MIDSDRHMPNDRLEPDLSAILAGTVPARWSRVAAEETTSQGTGYVLTNLKADFGSFEFTQNPVASGSSSKDGSTVFCELCPQNCRIPSGRMGRCSARVNVGGSLVSRFYGRPTSVAIDPIEKKPLYHFLPGTPILSLGTQGCNLSCRFCQNWQISRPIPIGTEPKRVLEPQQVVELAIQHRCPSVAFTYNEPTVWAEYVVDVGKRCHERGIMTVAVTNGMICGKAREDFYNVIDAANVDLKAFTSSFYRDLTNGNLEAVKSTLKYLARETKVCLEVTNLLIPGYNDKPEELKEMCSWLFEELGDNVPLHFSAFFPAWRLTDVPQTSLETLVMASQIAKNTGIKFVYRGNVKDESGQVTYCSKCGKELIRRSGYKTELTPLLDVSSTIAHCANCGEGIPGVFK